MFHRLKKFTLTPEQIAEKEKVAELKKQSERELQEAKQLALTLRGIRERNHFAEGFNKALGGQSQ